MKKRTGYNIAILYDTKGPEFRNGMLENDEINLVEGKTIELANAEEVEDPPRSWKRRRKIYSQNEGEYVDYEEV